MLLREPFCGPMSPAIYASTPDRLIVHCYLAPRDKQGQLVLEADRERLAKRRQREREAEERGEQRLTGKLSRAGRELPSAEALEVPEECFATVNGNGRTIPVSYVLLWWQTWRARNTLTTEQLTARWREEMAQYGFRLPR